MSHDLIGRQGIVTADKSFTAIEDSKVGYPAEHDMHRTQGCIAINISLYGDSSFLTFWLHA